MTEDHPIDRNNANIIIKSDNTIIRRLVKGAAINKGFSIEGNKSFTQEDSFIDNIICKYFIKGLKFKSCDEALVNSNGLPTSLSPVQVADGTFVTGTYAVVEDETTIQPSTIRRSNRLAGKPPDDPVT